MSTFLLIGQLQPARPFPMSSRCMLHACISTVGVENNHFLQCTDIKRYSVLKPNSWGILHKQTKHMGYHDEFHIYQSSLSIILPAWRLQMNASSAFVFLCLLLKFPGSNSANLLILSRSVVLLFFCTPL